MTTIREVRYHYDLLSVFYQLFWGEHIHHGYWYGDESDGEAQLNLIRRLARKAALRRGMRVLDVGCGLGGSSLWLAENMACEITAITLSPVQAGIARTKACLRGLGDVTVFRVHDANDLARFGGTYDCIWVIECSEHLTNKRSFFGQCGRLLAPGGRLALCSWLRTEPEDEQTIREIRKAQLCPSLLTPAGLLELLREPPFVSVDYEEITPNVARTWDRCIRISKRPLFRLLLPLMGTGVRRFVLSFELMRSAFREGAMVYGLTIAMKGA